MASIQDATVLTTSQAMTKVDTDTSAEGTFAFLVHSQDSLSMSMPPEIDNQRLARQKRRRTSPDDHAILEAEYERNPKPDKTTRQEIVKRVSLGEKEVQIWFQNRRQVTRRKSKPLLLHQYGSDLSSSQDDLECTHFSAQTGSQQVLPSSQSSITDSQDLFSHISASSKSSQVTDHGGNLQSSDHGATSCHTNAAEVPEQDCEEVSSFNKPQLCDLGDGCLRTTEELFKSVSQSTSTKRRPGYLANRRSSSFIVHNENADAADAFPCALSVEGFDNAKFPSRIPQPLRRTTSLVRLSTSLDGKAEVTTKTGTTPSPPRRHSQFLFTSPAPRANPGLQRSFSAVEPGTNKGVDKSLPLFPRRPGMGRSRDARTWEFYCDTDARNALTEQAEREESGSATAAIGLIRSQSNSVKTLTTNPNKRNLHSQKPESAKRVKSDEKGASKPKPTRATFSVPRPQSATGKTPKQKALKPVSKHGKGPTHSLEEFDDESDKENWVPGTRTSRPRKQRPVTSPATARILLESLREPSQSSSLSALLKRDAGNIRRTGPSTGHGGGKENGCPETDEELAAITGEAVVSGEEEDLDCVQNLLSLSHAAWQ